MNKMMLFEDLLYTAEELSPEFFLFLHFLKKTVSSDWTWVVGEVLTTFELKLGFCWDSYRVVENKKK